MARPDPLRTDARGRVLLPVYDTVYQVGTLAHVTAFSTDMTRLGWFESPGRVGVLPPIVVRKR